MTMQAVVYFRSGRVVELDAGDLPDEEPATTIQRLRDMPIETVFFQIGTHMIFVRELEQIELRLVGTQQEQTT